MIEHLEKAEDFDGKIAKGNVLVDFFATWCGPCQRMGRLMQEIEGDYPEVTFLKVDVDEFPEIAQRYFVSSIPAMVFYKDGKNVPVKAMGSEDPMLVGALPAADFEAVLKDTFDLKK